jgi:hypothetical protein
MESKILSPLSVQLVPTHREVIFDGMKWNQKFYREHPPFCPDISQESFFFKDV